MGGHCHRNFDYYYISERYEKKTSCGGWGGRGGRGGDKNTFSERELCW